MQSECFGKKWLTHKFRTFLSELTAYENNPEDVGYCFIIWMERLKELYTEYLLNKEENNTVIFLPDAAKFFSVKIFSYNIKFDFLISNFELNFYFVSKSQF